jgi:hypothetical protein
MLEPAKGEAMAMETVSLTIRAEPGAEVRVLPRTHSDPVDPVFTGKCDHDGNITVTLPRSYYVVLSPGYETTPVHLETGPTVQSVQLNKVQT